MLNLRGDTWQLLVILVITFSSMLLFLLRIRPRSASMTALPSVASDLEASSASVTSEIRPWWDTVTAHNTVLRLPTRIFVCGWDVRPLAMHVFPEVPYSPYNRNVTSTATDLLLMGMFGPCKASLSEFRGTLVFLNGEWCQPCPRGMARADCQYKSNTPCVPVERKAPTFYLGPCKHDASDRMQFFYAQFAALKFGIGMLRDRPQAYGSKFMVYANSNCVPFRDHAFHDVVTFMQKVGHELPVAAGKCVGHHPELHQRAPGGWEQNRYWLKDYRFMLAIENRKVQGYVDEKIVNAFFAGGIPVYYGTHEVFSMFNRDAFVYFDIDHPEPALQRILYLDTNRTAYEEVLSKPILATGAMEKFFSLSKGNGFVKDKIRRMVLGRRPHNLA